MKNTVLRYISIAAMAAVSIATLQAQDGEFVAVDNHQLKRITTEANFDFFNYTFYAEEDLWKGKIIAVSGSFVQQPVIGKGKRKFVQLTGKGSNGLISIVIYIDIDLTTSKVYGNDVPVFSNGMELYAFVQLTGASNFVNSAGSWLYLPTADGLLFFGKDDRYFQYPLWASRSLKK